MSRYTNFQLSNMADSLSALLPMRDVIGYKAALNMRALSGLIGDFISIKDALVREYGKEVYDDNGTVCDYVVTPDCDRFSEFISRVSEVGEVEHEITFHMLTDAEIIGKLSGEEMLAVDWMIEHEVAGDE